MRPCLATLLLLSMAAFAMQAPENLFVPAPEKAWAVVVGVSRYQTLPKEKWLDFADADAESVAKFLQSGQGLKFLPDHIITITNEKATLAEVKNAMGNWLLKKTKPGDSIFIFLAAHGFVEPLGERDAYVVAYDTSPENLYGTAYSFLDIESLVSKRLGRAGHIFLVTDACHAGKMAEAKAFHERMTTLQRREVFGLLAAEPQEESLEGRLFGGGHGAFTYYLLRGLQGEADANKNGMVEFSEALGYVRDQVAKATGGAQNPKEFSKPSADLGLSRVTEERADLGFSAPQGVQYATLMFNGPPNTELLVNGTSRGQVPHTGQLAVDQLAPNTYKLMAVTSRGQRVAQEVVISADPTEVEYNGTAMFVKPPKGRGLADLATADPDQRRVALENEGQQVLLAYLQGEAVPLGADDFERCARVFTAAAALTTEPGVLPARRAFCAGRAALYRGDLAAAAPLLEEARRLDPRDPLAYNALGVLNLERRNFAEALRQFQAASQRAIRWAYPHFNRALTYTAQNQFARAEEAYLEAIRLGPRYAYLHYSLGGLYMRINQPDRAEREFRRALELDLDAAAGHIALGNFYRSRQRDREAEMEYRRAQQAHPNDVPASVNLARLYRDQGRNNEAVRELEEALKRVDAPMIRQALEELRKVRK